MVLEVTVELRFRIIELVLHARQILTLNTEFAGVSLEPDRENDRFCPNRITIAKLDDKTAFVTPNVFDLSAESNVGPRILQIFLPLPKHPFPGSRLKLHVTAKIQKSRLCHDVLAFLVALHGLRVTHEGL